jgi:hypothetical protein
MLNLGQFLAGSAATYRAFWTSGWWGRQAMPQWCQPFLLCFTESLLCSHNPIQRGHCALTTRLWIPSSGVTSIRVVHLYQ